MKICRVECNRIFYYIIVLLAIICSGSPLVIFYYSKLSIGLFIVSMVAYLMVRRTNYKINKAQFTYIGLLMLALCLAWSVNLDYDFAHYIGKIISLATVLLVATIVPYDEFYKIYVKIITIICFYSLLLTGLFTFIPSLTTQLSEIQFENAGIWSHFKYIYYIWGGYSPIWTTIIRNSGFFREPGVYSTHICMAMILILAGKVKFNSDKTKKVLLILLFITGLTTFSTVGVIGSAICFIAYLRSENTKLSKYLYLTIALLVITYFGVNNQAVLFSKFNSSGANFVSVSDRTNGLTSAINVWMQNPIFGKGYSYFQSHKVGVSTFFIFDLGGKYGLAYVIVICSGILLFIESLTKDRMRKMLYMGVYSLFLISQGLVELPIFMIFQLYGVRQYKIKMGG